MAKERVVAIGFLTASDLERLGHQFKLAFPIPNAQGFEMLLQAIDEADIALCGSPREGEAGAGIGVRPQRSGGAPPRAGR